MLSTFNSIIYQKIFSKYLKRHIKNVLHSENLQIVTPFLYIIPWKHLTTCIEIVCFFCTLIGKDEEISQVLLFSRLTFSYYSSNNKLIVDLLIIIISIKIIIITCNGWHQKYLGNAFKTQFVSQFANNITYMGCSC